MNVEKKCGNCRYDDYICPNEYEDIQKNDFEKTLLLDFALNAISNCERCFCQGDSIKNGICHKDDAETCQKYEEKADFNEAKRTLYIER